MSKLQTSIALIQEPWLYKGEISGLRDCGQCLSAAGEDVRSCIYIKGLRYKKREGQECEMVVALACFPYEVNAPPPQPVRDLIRLCEAEKINLVIGCDVRGKDLLDFLGTTNLDILNIDCEPTFKNSVREEVINIMPHRIGGREDKGSKKPRKTAWQGYVYELTAKVSRILVRMLRTYEIEHHAESFSERIVSSYV